MSSELINFGEYQDDGQLLLCTVVLSVLVNRSAAGVSIPTELLYEDDYDYLCL